MPWHDDFGITRCNQYQQSLSCCTNVTRTRVHFQLKLDRHIALLRQFASHLHLPDCIAPHLHLPDCILQPYLLSSLPTRRTWPQLQLHSRQLPLPLPGFAPAQPGLRPVPSPTAAAPPAAHRSRRPSPLRVRSTRPLLFFAPPRPVPSLPANSRRGSRPRRGCGHRR